MFNQSNEVYAQLLSQNGTAVGSRTKMTRLTGEEVQLPFFYIDVENPKNYGGIRFEVTKPDNSLLSSNTLYSGTKPNQPKKRTSFSSSLLFTKSATTPTAAPVI